MLSGILWKGTLVWQQVGEGRAEHSQHKKTNERRMFDDTAGQLEGLVGREHGWSPKGRASRGPG